MSEQRIFNYEISLEGGFLRNLGTINRLSVELSNAENGWSWGSSRHKTMAPSTRARKQAKRDRLIAQNDSRIAKLTDKFTEICEEKGLAAPIFELKQYSRLGGLESFMALDVKGQSSCYHTAHSLAEAFTTGAMMADASYIFNPIYLRDSSVWTEGTKRGRKLGIEGVISLMGGELKPLWKKVFSI